MRSNSPIFIALDFPNAETTLAFLDQFDGVKPAVKIGVELFYAEGPSIVRAVRERGHEVFLDLKLYDIPNTVAHAVKSLVALDVQYLTVHASGGAKMLRAAVDAAGDMRILAVTQLTSFSEEEVQTTQLTSATLEESVVNLAKIAAEAGVAGTISSPLEAQLIADVTSADFLRITPGIRLAGDDAGDQTRITTPAKAREIGSTGLVVGRSITGATNPISAYQRVMTEWSN
ncbi:MAG TPA: orotidine-5'-phosphate decarboxylase [Lactobacillaceae bacterium]|jgi:orotidine-5'-phosphate decarboxylase